jgi:hypothetical protein
MANSEMYIRNTKHLRHMLHHFKKTEHADWHLPSMCSFCEGCTLKITILAQMRRYYTVVKVKGKVHPRRGHEGPWGRQRCTSTLSLTSALDRGGRTTRPGRFTPPPRGQTRYPLYRKLGGAQGRSGRVWKISHPPAFDPRTVQPVASRRTI